MKIAAGTTPEGAGTEREASQWVREMFGRVAPRYDLANHLLSGNIDKYWRRRTVSRVESYLTNPDKRVLDLACGTGDLLIAMERRAGRALLGSDFCHPMLTGAQTKLNRLQFTSPLFEGDALALPVASQSLDLITIAFGFRNLANYADGLRELKRVLRPGGCLAILEFSQPSNAVFRSLYDWYSKRVLPVLGGAISGAPEAYKYLPASVKKFPAAPELAEMMRECGYAHVDWEYMTFGIAALHLGRI